MARDQQADRVAPDGATDRPCRPRGADLPGDLAVARGPAPGDHRDGLEDAPVPGRPVGQVERRRSAGSGARRAGPRATARPASRWTRRGSVGWDVARVLDRDVEALRQLGVECRLRGQPRNGDDATVGGGEVERSPRAWDRRADDGVVRHGTSLAQTGRWYTPREYDIASATTELTLPIEGMTCASCVNRIERFLGKTPGVETATVNLATETATIRYLPDRADRADLVGAIEAAGYDVRTRPTRPTPVRRPASPPSSPRTTSSGRAPHAALLLRALGLDRGRGRDHGRDVRARRRLSRWTALNWLVLIPATFIQFWAGGRFYRAAWRAARHGTTNMDTLVAVGTTAAWAYSVVVTVWPDLVVVGRPRARHLLRLVDDHHRPRPARALARGAGQGPDDRRDPSAGRPQPGDRARRA